MADETQSTSSVPAAARRWASLSVRLTLLVVVPMVVYATLMELNGGKSVQRRAELLKPFVQEHPEAAPVIETYMDRQRRVSRVLALTGGINFLVFGAVAAFFGRRLARQLVVLQRAAERMAAGDLESDIDVRGGKEIHALVRSLTHMREGLRQKLILEAEEAALARDREVAQVARRMFVPATDRVRRDGVELTARCDVPVHGGRTFWQCATMGDGCSVVLVGRSLAGGTSAAMVASVATTCLRVHAARRRSDVLELLRDVHCTLRRADASQPKLCVDVLRFDPSRNLAELFSAGGEGVEADDERKGAGGTALGGEVFDVVRLHIAYAERLRLVAKAPEQGEEGAVDCSAVEVRAHEAAA